MQKLAHKILKILKEHVRENIREIEYNQDEINRMLSDPASSTRQKELELKYSLNQDLLKENEDFIKMQLEITGFLEKYGHLFQKDEVSENTGKDFAENDKMNVFTQTISGMLKFDPQHPHYNNPKFFTELLKYYQEREDYEKCQELLKLKKINN